MFVAHAVRLQGWAGLAYGVVQLGDRRGEIALIPLNQRPPTGSCARGTATRSPSRTSAAGLRSARRPVNASVRVREARAARVLLRRIVGTSTTRRSAPRVGRFVWLRLVRLRAGHRLGRRPRRGRDHAIVSGIASTMPRSEVGGCTGGNRPRTTRWTHDGTDHDRATTRHLVLRRRTRAHDPHARTTTVVRGRSRHASTTPPQRRRPRQGRPAPA
jgi:hypothetical protein